MLLIGEEIELRPSSGCTGSPSIAFWHSSVHILVCIILPIVLIGSRILSSHIRCAMIPRGKGAGCVGRTQFLFEAVPRLVGWNEVDLLRHKPRFRFRPHIRSIIVQCGQLIRASRF